MQYSFPVHDSTQMFVGGSVTARSTASTALGNSNAPLLGTPELTIPGYALFDLRAGIEADDGKWRVQVWGRNITDKFYRVQQFRKIDSVAEIVGMPATYGVTFSFRYR